MHQSIDFQHLDRLFKPKLLAKQLWIFLCWCKVYLSTETVCVMHVIRVYARYSRSLLMWSLWANKKVITLTQDNIYQPYELYFKFISDNRINLFQKRLIAHGDITLCSTAWLCDLCKKNIGQRRWSRNSLTVVTT